MDFKIEQYDNHNGPIISLRCPHCGHFGTFINVGTGIREKNKNYWFGIRICPNTKCKGLVFIHSDISGNIIRVFPAQTIPIDKSNIPEKVLNTFEESINCHSNNCFVASAIMIRKTLEEICEDKHAKGKNLKERLTDLGGKILIPKELIEGMDELRLLGNDAAHIEAKAFSQIGKEEIEISIEFTKEILKAVYQYDDLLSKLRSLKKNNN